MKLLTHNLLMCNKKGCTINNFPLGIKSARQNVIDFGYDQDLVVRTLKKLDLPALTEATKSIGIYKFDFENLTEEQLKSPEILNFINHIIFEVSIEEGSLVCKNCGKEYEIKNGIPNMVLNDDEV